MQLIKLFSATGALTSIEKTKRFLWKQTTVDGKHYLQDCDVEKNLVIDEQIIGRLSIESVIKTLGVYFDLRNSFELQFELMWNKLENASVKLQNVKFNQSNVIKCCNHFTISC